MQANQSGPPYIVRMPWIPILALAVTAMATGCMVVQPHVRGVSGSMHMDTAAGHVSIRFSDADHRHIRDYFASRRAAHPGRGRGRAHQEAFESLPPGIQKQIARGKGLPPGLKRHRLPPDLESGLSPLPAGYIRYRLGTDVVIFDTRANVVVDILQGI